jgi:outer membrane protein assembly factor BamB
MTIRRDWLYLGFFALLSPAFLLAGDWTQWGGSDCRNMVSSEKGFPETFETGEGRNPASGSSGLKNVKWVAKLGSESYGNPTVSGGRIFIGTNNGSPRDPKYAGDRCVVMCFEEATGKFLWQLNVPKLPQRGTFNGDCGKLGICSSPTVDGDRVYVVTNRCDVLCLSTGGLAAGNRGPFTDEARYAMGMDDLSEKIKLAFQRGLGEGAQPKTRPATQPGSTRPSARPGATGTPPVEEAGPKGAEGAPRREMSGEASKVVMDGVKLGLTIPGPPIKLGPADADIIWRYNMTGELDVWVQDASDCSTLIHGEYLYVSTSNGVDKSHRNVPSPDAPCLIVLNKRTGKLVAVEDAGMSRRILHGTWSSPSLGQVGSKTLVFFGGPDGCCYAFDAEPVPGVGGKPGVLRKVWSYDCVPPGSREVKYATPRSASEIIATPVFHKNRVYVAVGQDPRHGKGIGLLSCIDATGTGDISRTGRIWSYDKINRTLSTVSIADGLLYIGDFAGTVHCLDAETGQVYWTHDTNAPIWGSTFVADGKVYIGTGKGELWVYAAGKELKILSTIKLGSPMYNTPIAANGVLYVASNTHLYAVAGR